MSATIKWRAKEYTPTADQLGQHGWYAEAVINDNLDTNGLARKVAAASTFKPYEVEAIIKAIADQIYEECLESNRVYLQGSNNDSIVAFYPKVDGRINDEEATEAAGSPTVATEQMLNSIRKTATVQTSVGTNFNKQFALEAHFEKVESGNFNPPAPGQYRVSLSQNPSNSGATLSGAGNYDSGASVTVSTTVPSGKTFDGWYNGSTLVSSNASYTFTINANVSLVAKFSAAPSGTITLRGRIDKNPNVFSTLPTLNGVSLDSSAGIPKACGMINVGDTITIGTGNSTQVEFSGIYYMKDIGEESERETYIAVSNNTFVVTNEMVQASELQIKFKYSEGNNE